MKNRAWAAGWLSGLAPPSAQGVILETRDRVPRRASCVEPASPSACVSLSVPLMNKYNLKKEKKKGLMFPLNTQANTVQVLSKRLF